MLGCSQSSHDVTTANLLKRKLVKNVVGLQKSDQELRVSYKPTAFRRWVVDIDGYINDLAERIAIDACMADAPEASFDYKGDWLVNRNDDDLKRLAQRENMA